jgi:hemerythrin
VYGTPLLISEHTLYSLAEPQNFLVRHLGRVKVTERTHPESIYEVFDHDPSPIKEKKINSLKRFEEALAYYHICEVGRARTLLYEIVQDNPGDTPAQVYLNRCDDYLKTGVFLGTDEFTHELKWREEYELDIEEFDNHHRELLIMIGKLHKSVTTGNNPELSLALISTLESDIQEHFRYENKLMAESHYPFISDHISQHKSYNNYILKLKGEIEANVDDPLYLGFRINLFLADWLLNHSHRDDRHMCRYLVERGVLKAH